MNDRSSRQKRRLIHIGPGLIIALILSALLAANWIKTERQARQQPSAPPIVERQVVSSSSDEKAGPTPEVRFILDRAEKVGLTTAQVAKLQKLQSDWTRFSEPKLAQANEAAAKTGSYLNESKGQKRTPTAHIEDQARPLMALSGEISSARRNYWNLAMKVLEPSQREAVRKEREADWAAKQKALADKVRESQGG
jgi:hypothetical protein